MTGAVLDGVEMHIEIPEARLYWGRKLGYTDDAIYSMWLKDARRPRYIDVGQLDQVMTKGEADWHNAQNR